MTSPDVIMLLLALLLYYSCSSVCVGHQFLEYVTVKFSEKLSFDGELKKCVDFRNPLLQVK